MLLQYFECRDFCASAAVGRDYRVWGNRMFTWRSNDRVPKIEFVPRNCSRGHVTASIRLPAADGRLLTASTKMRDMGTWHGCRRSLKSNRRGVCTSPSPTPPHRAISTRDDAFGWPSISHYAPPCAAKLVGLLRGPIVYGSAQPVSAHTVTCHFDCHGAAAIKSASKQRPNSADWPTYMACNKVV